MINQDQNYNCNCSLTSFIKECNVFDWLTPSDQQQVHCALEKMLISLGEHDAEQLCLQQCMLLLQHKGDEKCNLMTHGDASMCIQSALLGLQIFSLTS